MLHARVGQQEVRTAAVKAEKTKQFTWEDRLLLKFRDQHVLHVWLTDELRKDEHFVVGECRINLDVIDRNKIELFLFWNERETAIVEVTMALDQRGTSYVAPEKRTKKLFLKFHIKEADLLIDTEVFGSMKPAVKIRVG